MNRFLALALAAAVLCTSPAAFALTPRLELEAPTLVVRAQSDCRAIGQQIADQNGGTLADAHVENRGGQNVCVGVVLVPARDGERGRQVSFAVPM